MDLTDVKVLWPSNFHSVQEVFVSSWFCWTLTAEKAAPHEAAYDAFLCGSGKMLLQPFLKIFLQKCQFLSFPALWLCCLFNGK